MNILQVKASQFIINSGIFVFRIKSFVSRCNVHRTDRMNHKVFKSMTLAALLYCSVHFVPAALKAKQIAINVKLPEASVFLLGGLFPHKDIVAHGLVPPVNVNSCSFGACVLLKIHKSDSVGWC